MNYRAQNTSEDNRYAAEPQTGLFNASEADLYRDEQIGTFSFWDALRAVMNWWWVPILAIGTIMAITAFLLFNMKPIYSASSTVEVKQESRKIIDISEVETINADREFLTTQIELLKSESLIEEIVNVLNLVSDPEYAYEDADEWNALPRTEKTRVVVQKFSKNLSVSPIGRSRLIRVRFEHPNPRSAAAIANAVPETFISNELERKFNATAEARQFLEERLEVVKTSLRVAENNLVRYASENDLILLNREAGEQNNGSLDTSALVSLDADLTKTQTDRVEAETAYRRALDSDYSGEILKSEAINLLKSEKFALEVEYRQKLEKFKPEYPEMKYLQERINLFDEEIAEEVESLKDGSLADLKTAYDLALARERSIEARMANRKNSVISEREKIIQYNILRRQVETDRTQYEALLQRLKEVSVSDDLGANLVQLVDQAQVPRVPSKPNKLRTLILAFLFSIALSFGIIYLLNMIDDRIKTPDDVKNKLKQVIMGVIPFLHIEKDDDLILKLRDPQSGISEAYASLRTNLQFSGQSGGPRVIQVTSTRGSEGKSVSSTGLALRFAGLGERVLLIDADLRLPTFDSDPTKTMGLSGLLTSNAPIADHILSTNAGNKELYLLPSGPVVPDPSEILSTSRFDEILNFGREHFDHIIVDSPPVLGLADAPIIASKVDASLLIVESDKMRTPNVKDSISRLKTRETNLLGVVLTKFKPRSGAFTDYYKYSYGNASRDYGQGGEQKKQKQKQKRRINLT